MIIDEFNILRNQTRKISKYSENNTVFLDEYHNSLVPLYTSEKRIEININQLIPNSKNVRNKGGLFNPLGSFIK